MKAYSQLTQEVDSARKGRRIAAFFDFDGTLLCGFSVLFFLYRRYLSGQVSRSEALDQISAMANYGFKRLDFADLLTEFAQSMGGLADEEMWALAEEVFRKDLAGRIYPETRALLRAHQAKGHTVVILSSATQYQLVLAADELGVEHLICTRLEIENGRLTGRMQGPACFGEEKYVAAKEFAEQHNIALESSYFYSDGAEDLPLLEAVGHPRPLNPDQKLAARALDNGWPVQTFDSRGSPGMGELVRTG